MPGTCLRTTVRRLDGGTATYRADSLPSDFRKRSVTFASARGSGFARAIWRSKKTLVAPYAR
jgi:hypothetical protein